MPISINKIIRCRKCGKKIGVIRSGDVLNPKEGKLIYNSYCAKCKIKKVIGGFK
ncbi:hypothetical protein [Solibacillus sp. FSL K6-1523]|uniref:hypothetical protein n=1 Tax=Solibacillus sp. FSL K6-1523 TaxID=2921471 RepID=UPI0030FC4951